MPTPTLATAAIVAEAMQLTEAQATPAAGGSVLVRLITPGWGSSGYYSPQVLEAAGADRVFPAGTHMYLNHPSYSEQSDRPERDVRDLAAVLREDARWDATEGALVAPADVFPDFREFVAARVGAMGTSIRAAAEMTSGEAEGRVGNIVTRLVEGVSVDFVTHAGRGGSYTVTESARPSQVVARAIAAGVAEASANDTRDALQTALRDRFAAEQRYVWVRDFDEAAVYFEVDSTDGRERLYSIGYTIGADTTAALEGDPTEVVARTQYVPVDPAGQSTTTQESEEDTMPQIEEAHLRQLEADAGRVQALEAERDAAVERAATAEARVGASLRISNAATAARIAHEAASAATSPVQLDDFQLRGITADAPLTEDGTVDEAAMRAHADTAVASILERGGSGRVRNPGSAPREGEPGEHHVSDTDWAALEESAYGPIPKEA